MDPIDGTANLVKQNEDYCIILAYFIDGKPQLSYIYDHARENLYSAISNFGVYLNDIKLDTPPSTQLKDAIVSFDAHYVDESIANKLRHASFSNRYVGSCGLDSIRVIKGQFGAHINTNPKPWDIAAQHLFAKELGLKMTQLNGEALNIDNKGPFIISNPGCYDEIVSIFKNEN